MTNIKDLAKYCNVSVTTVSYALNDNPEISNETKEKVKKAALELNYVPSAYARGLKKKKTFNIGVFIPGFEGPIHHTVLSGIANRLSTNQVKYNMLVTLADEYMTLIKERIVDLAIIMDSKVKNQDIINLSKIIPIVTFDMSVEGENIFPTFITNKEGMYNLTERLIKKGCKNIAYLLGSSDSYHNHYRYQGYLQALKDNSIQLNNNIIYDANAFTEEKGYEVIKKVLKKVNGKLPFDALMCGNDELAIGSMRALDEFGYNIPKDVKVTGFDNIDKSKLVTPKLTTVAINWFNYGEKMVNLALQVLDNTAPKSLTIETEIIERESTK